MSRQIKIQLAREFRKNLTKSERMMWNALRRNSFLGLNFRRQHIVNGFILDFYCHKLKLAIEIDGDIHLNQIEEDKKRQRIIENSNIKFFRVSSDKVEKRLEEVLKNLEIFIQKNMKFTHPLPLHRSSGGGAGREGKFSFTQFFIDI